jgi:hypothetical protein
MSTLTIKDNAIWIKHLPEPLQERARQMQAGETVRLEIDGVVGVWQRMDDGQDGRPTFGLKPIDAMREVWLKWQARRGETVVIKPVGEDAVDYLKAVSETLSEWSSAEDELAYGDL